MGFTALMSSTFGRWARIVVGLVLVCLLYTSDAADEEL
jgi:hypothetical protein